MTAVLASALLSALAFPPFEWERIAWFALVPFLLAVRGQRLAAAFRYGCLLGYAYGWALLWPLLEAAGAYLSVSRPLASIGVTCWFLVVVGIPFGVFGSVAAFLLRLHDRGWGPFAIGAAWVGCEMLRARGLGQPWGLLGYSQHAELPIVQIAALTGVYGISFLLVTISAAVAETIAGVGARCRTSELARCAAPAAALLVACWLHGDDQLGRAGTASPGDTVGIAVVQTNVTPDLRWTESYVASQLRAHLRATDTLSEGRQPRLIVWPEYAVPRHVDDDPGLLAVLRAATRRHHADLLFGTSGYADGRSYNSVRLLTASGFGDGRYDKRRLVLFAERMPLVHDDDRFVAGDQPGVLRSFTPLGVSICHEIIHPDLISDDVRHGARVLVNLANDSWLTRLSDGPGRQHVAMATLRAVETRRYLVRAAITGPSAVIDPFGRLVAFIGPGEPGVLAVDVEPASTLTWYVRHGDVFGFGCVLLVVVALARVPFRPGLVLLRPRIAGAQ
jgi:apolipoprotein N-acyltransferase